MTGRCMSRKAGACCRMFAGHRDSHESWYGERWDDGDAAVADTTPETPAAQIAEALAPAPLPWAEEKRELLKEIREVFVKLANSNQPVRGGSPFYDGLKQGHENAVLALDRWLDSLPAVPPPDDRLDTQLLAWTVVNCHMLARRALARSHSAYDREKWEHVLRICEKAGARSQGVLRASLPTEITEGAAPLPVDLARLLAEINNAMQQWDICRHRVRAASGEWRDLGAVLVDCRSLISRVEATEQQYRDWLDNVPGHPCGCGQEVNGHGVIIATHHACEAHKALAAKVEALEQERDGLSFNLDAAVDALAKWQAKRADARAR
jgi:hypothetical protein